MAVQPPRLTDSVLRGLERMSDNFQDLGHIFGDYETLSPEEKQAWKDVEQAQVWVGSRVVHRALRSNPAPRDGSAGTRLEF